MKKNILIVDDNTLHSEVVSLLIKECNNVPISIFTAENGKEAVSLCTSEKIDLIFMDQMMPIMNGVEATKIIKRNHPEVIIVAISSIEDREIQEEMLLSGAEDYVLKPIDSRSFTNSLYRYFHLIQTRNHISKTSNSQNLFTSKTYNYYTSFIVATMEDLAEFWEAVLIRLEFNRQVEDITDLVRTIYRFGEVLLKNNTQFNIIIEEELKNFFFTISNIQGIGCKEIDSLIKNCNTEAVYICKDDKLSFILKRKSSEVYLDKVPLPSKEKSELKASASSKSVEQEVSSIKEDIDTMEDKQVRELSIEEKKLLKRNHKERAVSSKEYANEIDSYVLNEIQELDDIEADVKHLIDRLYKKNFDEMKKVVTKLNKFASVLNRLIEFKELSFSLKSLAEVLGSQNIAEVEKEIFDKILRFLSNIILDLSSWRKIVFIEQSANDIHYMDSSLFSSILQLELLFNADQQHEDENDFELF